MIKRVVLYYFIVQLQHIYPKSGYQEFVFIFVIPKKEKGWKVTAALKANSQISLLFQYKLDIEIALRTWVELKSFYFGVNHVCTHSKAFLSRLCEE